MKLANVADIRTGYPFRGKIPEKSGSHIRAVQMKDIRNDGTINWSSAIETELTGIKQPDWILKGDILFVARGLKNYAVLVDAQHDQIICAPHFYHLRVNSGSVLPDFIAWQLNTKPLENYFTRSSEGTMAKSIRRGILENAQISIPSMEKQRKILQLHSAVQKQRTLYTTLINQGENLMNAIATDLVTGQQPLKDALS